MKSCAIILNGDVNCEIEEDFIICADGGMNKIANRKPNIFIGDGDSFGGFPDNVEIQKYDKDKDLTDGEACVNYALEKKFESISIYGLLGGRFDHQMCNLALLSKICETGRLAVAKDEKCKIYACSIGKFDFCTKKGKTISILPYGGNVAIKNSNGLKWEYNSLTLKTNETRGISNVALCDCVTLDIENGQAMIIIEN